MNTLPIYIDIDGTLTDNPQKGGKPIESRIEKVRRLVQGGTPIVLWSGGGEDYVRLFCQRHHLKVYKMLGKPQFCVDNNPKIRPRFQVETPEWLDS